MTWSWPPWKCRRADKPQPEPSDDVEEAAKLRRREQASLERDRANGGAVRDLAERLRRHREINHFAELIGDSFGKEPRDH